MSKLKRKSTANDLLFILRRRKYSELWDWLFPGGMNSRGARLKYLKKVFIAY